MSFGRRMGSLVPLLALVASVGACGYQFQGTGNALPSDVKTVAIPIFRNDSDLEGVELDFTEALIQQFVRGRQVRIVDDVADANAVVKGLVRRVRVRAVSFSETDEALEAQMTVVLSVSLERARDGKVLWADNGVSDKEEFAVTADAVVTRSPEFIGRSSTFNNLDDIEITQEESAAAIERLSRRMAKSIYSRMLEDF
ncbi:MAG: LptE family protein [bacterium]